MRKFVAGIVGSVTVACLLPVTSPAFAGFQGPPYGWAFTFDQAKIIGENTPVTAENGLSNAPVRTSLGSTIAHFVRIEMQDGVMPMGIITLDEIHRTIAVPLDRFRFNPERREILTDMSWHEAILMPSGRRLKGTPWYPYGRPVA
jgi:hypothetical protein